MITLLHGDDIVSSRKALEALKLSRQQSEVLFLEGPKVSLTDLKQALESSSLLAFSRLVILERFLSSRPNKEKLVYLASGQFGADLIFWERKKIPPGTIKKLGPQAKVQLFKTPALVFRFLDGFGSPNRQNSLLLLKKAAFSSPSSLVFYLLVKRIRDLLLVKGGGEPSRIQAWQLKKLQTQARFFHPGSLERVYRRLLEIDRAEKTGEKRFNLEGELEMLILDIDQS